MSPEDPFPRCDDVAVSGFTGSNPIFVGGYGCDAVVRTRKSSLDVEAAEFAWMILILFDADDEMNEVNATRGLAWVGACEKAMPYRLS